MAIAAALATSTATGPAQPAISATIAGPADGSEMSAGTAMPPVRAANSDSRPSSVMSLTATLYPSAASRRAVACPSPCAAPVTSATGPGCPGISDHRSGVGREHLTAVHGAFHGEIVHRMGDLAGGDQAAQRERGQVLGFAPQGVPGEQRSIGRAGRDRVDPDAGFRHLQGQRLDETEDRALRPQPG